MIQDDRLEDLANDKLHELLADVIKNSEPQTEQDDVARALLYLLVRVSNTWRSIRTLDKYMPDEESPMLDAGVLLRVMFDANLQAEYIASDKDEAVGRARDYLDFEHIERYKRFQKTISHDNPITDKLKSSPDRPESEKRLQKECDRVKARFLIEKRRRGGTIKRGPNTRTNWFPGTLADIARSLEKADEYDILLANCHGCVHSSAFAVKKGPVVLREQILDWASTIAARVAQLSVQHNDLRISQFQSRVLTSLCKPYFLE